MYKATEAEVEGPAVKHRLSWPLLSAAVILSFASGFILLGPSIDPARIGSIALTATVTVAAPLAPASYAIPAGSLSVSDSAELNAALARTTATDIVLADGIYDNPGPFVNTNGHRLYAARLLGATLTAGVNLASNYGTPNGLIQGIAFDVRDLTKTMQGGVVFTWGTSLGTSVLDSTFNGNKVIMAAIMAYQPDGLRVERVQVRDFTDWGVLADTNVATSVLATPALLQDIDVAGVSRAVPKSAEGRAEACLGVGNTATVRRVRVRDCAWSGITTMNAAQGAFFSDLDIDGGPYAGMLAGAGSQGSVGLYIEHFTSSTTFQRIRIGPNLSYGVLCEGTDPNGTAWGGVSSSIDNVFQDATIDSAQVGVLMGWGTTRTTVRRVVFHNQYVAAITDYLGIANAYYDNNYAGILPGAIPMSPVWWRTQ
ncbi:MAG: hypothetical protein H0W18_05325 [Acidobacteria bacterium]|nr:hypothetical protein [Acidobacteriota bacterium]